MNQGSIIPTYFQVSRGAGWNRFSISIRRPGGISVSAAATLVTTLPTQVGVVLPNPVFTARGEEINIHGVLESLDAMRRVRRDH